MRDTSVVQCRPIHTQTCPALPCPAQTLDLPEALVHWGHPGNMAVVLLAMGGYGALTLGWQIRTTSDSVSDSASALLLPNSTLLLTNSSLEYHFPLPWQCQEVLAKAKDMHPKLAGGMFVFFALGAIGGMMSLLMQDKPIFESPHVWSGLAGLGLLALQATLPAFFASQGQSARDVVSYLP